MIELEAVALRYREGPEVLKDLTFRMRRGELRFLTGPSGAGKSTFLRLLFFALKPTRGRAAVLGRDVAGVSARELPLLRRKLGVVFQDFHLLDHLSVFENVALPLRAMGQAREDYNRDVLDLLDWVGLKGRAGDLPDTLSGGEKQRAAIARAVVARPELILADEPTGNVDPAMAKRLLHLFLELNRLGTTVFLATHDEALIAQAGGKAVHLEHGALREL
ncbi:MAG: cell division ATP-binding protein FtsE [Alphaproteobacteria bacterium]|nr:cell division ATP-binding protein FtsE [Alphaproteobacteria bacterium]